MQRSTFQARPFSPRLTLLALGFAAFAACKVPAAIGRQCDGGRCEKPVECSGDDCKPPCVGDGCNPPPPPLVCTPDRCDPGCAAGSCGMPALPCDGAPCEEPPRCDAASCEPPVPDACANGQCEVDACSGLACAAPSCDGGVCQAGVCDGGPCEVEPGCNASFPICAVCQEHDDCTRDRDEPRCDRARGRCVECIDDRDCGGVERFCRDGDCDECLTDAHCNGLPCRNGDCGID